MPNLMTKTKTAQEQRALEFKEKKFEAYDVGVMEQSRMTSIEDIDTIEQATKKIILESAACRRSDARIIADLEEQGIEATAEEIAKVKKSRENYREQITTGYKLNSNVSEKDRKSYMKDSTKQFKQIQKLCAQLRKNWDKLSPEERFAKKEELLNLQYEAKCNYSMAISGDTKSLDSSLKKYQYQRDVKLLDACDDTLEDLKKEKSSKNIDKLKVRRKELDENAKKSSKNLPVISNEARKFDLPIEDDEEKFDEMREKILARYKELKENYDYTNLNKFTSAEIDLLFKFQDEETKGLPRWLTSPVRYNGSRIDQAKQNISQYIHLVNNFSQKDVVDEKITGKDMEILYESLKHGNEKKTAEELVFENTWEQLKKCKDEMGEKSSDYKAYLKDVRDRFGHLVYINHVRKVVEDIEEGNAERGHRIKKEMDFVRAYRRATSSGDINAMRQLAIMVRSSYVHQGSLDELKLQQPKKKKETVKRKQKSNMAKVTISSEAKEMSTNLNKLMKEIYEYHHKQGTFTAYKQVTDSTDLPTLEELERVYSQQHNGKAVEEKYSVQHVHDQQNDISNLMMSSLDLPTLDEIEAEEQRKEFVNGLPTMDEIEAEEQKNQDIDLPTQEEVESYDYPTLEQIMMNVQGQINQYTELNQTTKNELKSKYM